MAGTALMSTDVERIFTALGVLKADMSNLAEKFDDLNVRVTDEQRKVHDIVVATSEAQRVVVRQIDNLQRLVDEMKPLTDDYREKRAEARGAAKLAGWLYTAAAAAGGLIVVAAGKAVEWFSNRPHIPIILMLITLLAVTKALAQHNHAQHHDIYKNWINKNDRGCCNNQDCGELADMDERTTAVGGIEVRIEGIWCPVQPFHYLKQGNAPNWSTAHVCVQKQVVPGAVKVCDRLLCYQPRPGI